MAEKKAVYKTVETPSPYIGVNLRDSDGKILCVIKNGEKVRHIRKLGQTTKVEYCSQEGVVPSDYLK